MMDQGGCDCLSRLPSELRSAISKALERFPTKAMLSICANVEQDLSRAAFHSVLQWVDSLNNCPACSTRYSLVRPHPDHAPL